MIMAKSRVLSLLFSNLFSPKENFLRREKNCEFFDRFLFPFVAKNRTIVFSLRCNVRFSVSLQDLMIWRWAIIRNREYITLHLSLYFASPLSNQNNRLTTRFSLLAPCCSRLGFTLQNIGTKFTFARNNKLMRYRLHIYVYNFNPE